MLKITFWGKPKQAVEITNYILYVSTHKGKVRKWAGECEDRAQIDSWLKRYFDNNDYVSALINCKYGDNCNYIEYQIYLSF